MMELSAGKDSVTGHWELMGVVLERPFPVFPAGFPLGIVQEFERRIGQTTLGNKVGSGTAVIDQLGLEHMRTGHPIVYTSADSVFQLAAHENVVPVGRLYEMCEIAFELFVRGLGVGRVIARPFTGEAGGFIRTGSRKDFVLEPVDNTLLDHLRRANVPVVTIGKVRDLFAGRSIDRSFQTTNDDEGLVRLQEALTEESEGLIFANLGDLDTRFGHRNDVKGYAAQLETIDAGIGDLLARLAPTDLLAITADHGNDPTTLSTDHSREYVPLLLAGACIRAGADLGTRRSFSDLGQTLADGFGVEPLRIGVSFLEDIRVEYSRGS
jgi:phosphopentomutase